MTCLSGNFLATLSTSEQSSVVLSLTEANATDYWSNLPVTFATRQGITIESMTSTQAAAAEALLAAALSDAGEETMSELRTADGYLGDRTSGYGKDLYYVSFLGTPDGSGPYIVEFTGHHYTFFYSVNGDTGVSLTPNFVGVEPTNFTSDGTTFQPMADNHDALLAMLTSLSSTQLAAAKLGSAYDDLIAGPGKDGNFPTTQQGLAVSTLSSAQRDLVSAAIDSYSGDAQETGQTDAYTSDTALNQTYISWASYSDLATRGSYVRIDGPRVWIEFSVQNGIVFSANHYHSIWRDKTADYGGNFSF